MSMGGGEPECKNVELIPAAVASSSVPPSTPQWIELPTDVTANILQRLGPVEILESAENVCTTWRTVCADPAMWRVLHIGGPFAPYWSMPEKLWRRAVDRSQGQVVDLRIQNFCSDNLLNYIADRSIGLKRLTLDDSRVTRKGLNEAVKKLAHLEELHLVIMPSLQAEDIMNFGISCPNLKSFTFNAKGFSSPYYTNFAAARLISNEYALAIAENMPNLCHLSLIANRIGNEGLEAILDGCPNLESLDLRQCLGLNLHRALSKRCSEQIKLLKLPSDPVSFVEYRGVSHYLDDDDDDDYDYYDDEYYDDDDVIVFDSDSEYLLVSNAVREFVP